MIYKSYSYDDTVNIAKEFAKNLKKGDVVRLFGDVGAGKTAFVCGAAKAVCGKSESVCSPTFSIMNIYEGDTRIFHFDLYRLEDADEIYMSGLCDYIGGDAVTFVEWPQILDISQYARVFDVKISRNLNLSDDFRNVEITLTKGAENENSCH